MGQLATVEGLLRDVVTDPSMDQLLRRIYNEEGCKKVEELLDEIRAILGSDDDKEMESGVKTIAEILVNP